MEGIIYLLISLLLGGIIGYLISSHFHKKNEVFVKDMHNVVNSIENIYLSSKYSNIFQSPSSFVKYYTDQRPSDRDIPHLQEIWCESNKVKPGEKLFLLIRLVDMGRNLSTRSGVEIRNKLNNYNIPTFYEGFGWISCNIDIPTDAPKGQQKINIKLEDRIKNKNTQEFDYVVT